MGTVLMIGGLGVLFALFAILGPAEQPKPCGGRSLGQAAFPDCPLEHSGTTDTGWKECPGAATLRKEGDGQWSPNLIRRQGCR
jgi:hypothetical protein